MSCSNEEHVVYPPLVTTMAGETGVTVFYTPALKADRMAGHICIKEAGWAVMIPQPASELEENAAALKIISLFIATAGILLASSSSSLVSELPDLEVMNLQL